MKRFLNIFLAMTIGILAIGFQSCGGDDEPDAKIYATSTEIQGTWHGTLNGYYYTISFSGNTYTYGQMDAKTHEIKSRSHGEYSIVNHVINFNPNNGVYVPWTGYEIYWNSHMKNTLNIGDYLSLTKSS